MAEDLQQSGFALGGRRLRCTVMFSDIRGFTSLCEKQSPEETIELLNTYYTLMFDAISGHGGGVNQMIGDGLMAIFGAPRPLPEPELATVRASLEAIGDRVAMEGLVVGYCSRMPSFLTSGSMSRRSLTMTRLSSSALPPSITMPRDSMRTFTSGSLRTSRKVL